MDALAHDGVGFLGGAVMLGQFLPATNVGDHHPKDEDKDYKKNGDADEGQKIFHYLRVLPKEGFFSDHFHLLTTNNSYHSANYPS